MKKLYNALSEQGKYTKSFEDFQTQFGSKEGQEKLYGALERSGDYTKSFEDFSGQFFSGAASKDKRLCKCGSSCGVKSKRYGITIGKWFFGATKQ